VYIKGIYDIFDGFKPLEKELLLSLGCNGEALAFSPFF
jgi:hypothetical protein